MRKQVSRLWGGGNRPRGCGVEVRCKLFWRERRVGVGVHVEMGWRLAGSLGTVCWARRFGLDPGAVGWCRRSSYCGLVLAEGSERRAGSAAWQGWACRPECAGGLGWGPCFSFYISLPKCAVSSLGVADVFWKEHWVTWTPAPTPLWFPRALFSSSLFLDRLGLFLQAHHVPFLQKPHCR